jgi:hypothetical protein
MAQHPDLAARREHGLGIEVRVSIQTQDGSHDPLDSVERLDGCLGTRERGFSCCPSTFHQEQREQLASRTGHLLLVGSIGGRPAACLGPVMPRLPQARRYLVRDPDC